MASSSSSKAPPVPEWRRKLDATPVEELCSSQQDIIRAVSLLEDLVDECTKSPLPTVKDMNRAIKLLAGLLEVKSLGIQGVSMLLIYPEKSKLVRQTLAKLASEYSQTFCNSGSDPSFTTDTETIIVTMPEQLFLVLQFLLSRADDVGNLLSLAKDDPYWAALRRLSLGTPQWAVAFLNELKTSGGDLLKKVGSKLTVDQLLTWNKVFAPAEHIAKYILAEDPKQMVLSLLDILKKWLETFANAPLADHYSWCLARSIVDRTLASTDYTALRQLSAPPGTDTMKKIKQKWEPLMSLALEFFAKELVAARAAVPQDPVQIAWCSFYCASLASESYGVDQSLSQMFEDCVVESRAAAQRAKPWLPPAMYKLLNINIKASENRMHGVHQSLDDARSDVLESLSVAQAKLDECCNVCKVAGREFTLKCCSQCRKVYYCSRECQKKDWKVHKKVCQQLAAAAEAAEES